MGFAVGVGEADFDVADKFETLLNGGIITQTISDALTYDSLHSSEDNLCSTKLLIQIRSMNF